MGTVTLQVTGIPVALRSEEAQDGGPLGELNIQLKWGMALALGSARQVATSFGYTDVMPDDGFVLTVSVGGLEPRNHHAETVAAVLGVVMIHFAGSCACEYREILVFAFGRKAQLGRIQWEHPRSASARTLLGRVERVEAWARIFSEREEEARLGRHEDEGDAWSSLRVWAEEVLRDLERFHGTPLARGSAF